jgi:hypothetical protein
MKTVFFSTITVMLLIMVVNNMAIAQGWAKIGEEMETLRTILVGAAIAYKISLALNTPKLPSDWNSRIIFERRNYLLRNNPFEGKSGNTCVLTNSNYRLDKDKVAPKDVLSQEVLAASSSVQLPKEAIALTTYIKAELLTASSSILLHKDATESTTR